MLTAAVVMFSIYLKKKKKNTFWESDGNKPLMRTMWLYIKKCMDYGKHVCFTAALLQLSENEDQNALWLMGQQEHSRSHKMQNGSDYTHLNLFLFLIWQDASVQNKTEYFVLRCISSIKAFNF